MLRDRLVGVRWLVRLVVAWGVVLALVPHPADAAPIPPAPVEGSNDLEAVADLLERKIIGARLGALGLSRDEVRATLERLSPAERADLAARADEIATGGSGVEILAISIILGMLVILILELMGRRVISRP